MRYDVLIAAGYLVGFIWLFRACRRAEARAKAMYRLTHACGLQEWN